MHTHPSNVVDLGRALKVLKISFDMPKNGRSDPLYWLLRNLPQTLEELSLNILGGKTDYYINHDSEEEFKGLEVRSQTAVEALAELERYDSERDRRMDLEEEAGPARPIPSLSLKSLSLAGSYSMPQTGMDGCSIGSTFVVRVGDAQVVRPAYFLEELEQLIRQCRPTLESLTMDMKPYGCLFVTGVRPKEWFGLKDLARIVTKSGSGSALQSLSNFSTSTEWPDEDIADILYPPSPSEYNHSLESTSTLRNHHFSSNPSVWRNLSLMEIEDTYIRTSTAILKHVSTLENLILKLSKGFPSQDLSCIFRTSPRLRCLLGIEDNNDPKQDYGDPYLNVFMDAQDLLLLLHQIDRFWSTWTDRTKVHPQNRGWVSLSGDDDDRHHSHDRRDNLKDWACHESLETLQIMIKNVPRPDVTRSQYGGRLSRLRNGTLAHEEYQERHVAVQVEQELCRRLGQMTKLKKLILGIDDRKWKELSLYRDIPKDRLRDLGIDWDPGEEEDDGSDYSDDDFYWEDGMSVETPLMFYDEGFQYSCLSLSLDAGLEHLAGLKNLEVLSIERMAHRVRLPEVQWMMANWPKLRRIEGLAHKQDDRCKVPRETEEAVQWLQGDYPRIELPLSPDNMRQRSWTNYAHHMIWY